jgi:hypothetical protein
MEVGERRKLFIWSSVAYKLGPLPFQHFVRDVRGVKDELDGISQELQSLKAVLEILADDAGDFSRGRLPDTLEIQVTGIVTNCMSVVVEIEQTLNRHEGSRLAKAARWTAIGQGDISKLRSSLEAHKSALEIALDMVTSYGYPLVIL